MITQVKLNAIHSDEEVVISLEQMTHMKATADSYGNQYTEIHFTGGQSIDVKQNIQECQQAIAMGLHGAEEIN